MPHTFLQKRWSMTLFAWRRSRVWNVFSSSSSSFSSSSFFLYGFLWFELCYGSCYILCPDEEEEDGPQEGGGTRAPLYIYEKLQRHVSSPLLPTICYQRLIKMLTNTRDPSCVWRGFLSLLFFLFGSFGCCCFSSSSCAGCGWASSK